MAPLTGAGFFARLPIKGSSLRNKKANLYGIPNPVSAIKTILISFILMACLRLRLVYGISPVIKLIRSFVEVFQRAPEQSLRL
ncbi:hypothetical protein JGUZn3_03910 [Entomobacter blattae]|uniref:Uncharacterized protein n=1 Tax=Entomobacter blattae TaxID=2762277 RepID=A0A7H1NPD2_9PROT|nr:hypothetical protein JGUZn3_03910 [Entomobacter blattae]